MDTWCDVGHLTNLSQKEKKKEMKEKEKGEKTEKRGYGSLDAWIPETLSLCEVSSEKFRKSKASGSGSVRGTSSGRGCNAQKIP